MAGKALYETGRCPHQPLLSLHLREYARALSQGWEDPAGVNSPLQHVDPGDCARVIRIGELSLYQFSQPVSQPLTTYYLARV